LEHKEFNSFAGVQEMSKSPDFMATTLKFYDFNADDEGSILIPDPK